MKSWPQVEIPYIAKSDQPLKLFSTDRQKLVELPLKDKYQIYVCGITPYDATHLGHAATYLTFDILIRYLKALGSEVNYIQNITDIDDPLLERANRDKVDWRDLAYSQIDLFRSDMQALRILPPTHYEGAVDSIPDVVTSIKILSERGCVYKVDSDLYMEIAKDPDFGFESGMDRESMLKIFSERGGDPAREGKRDPLDPLLWLSERQGEPSWPSEYGAGRPGWHIECAAIALKFAEQISDQDYILDVQGGGSDLIFPHHEMSASQCVLLTGKKLTNAFVHTGLIGLDGEKMSKSKGNLVFVSKLIESGVNPMAIRWALLKRDYRSDYMWLRNETDNAAVEIAALKAKLKNDFVPPTSELIKYIYISIANDLDTPNAISAINNWVATDGSGGNASELAAVIDALLGIKLKTE